MKKLSTILLVSGVLSFYGCSKKDAEYYKKNINEADKLLTECYRKELGIEPPHHDKGNPVRLNLIGEFAYGSYPFWIQNVGKVYKRFGSYSSAFKDEECQLVDKVIQSVELQQAIIDGKYVR